MSASVVKNQNTLSWQQALYTLNKIIALSEEESATIASPSTVLLFLALLLKTSPYLRGSVSTTIILTKRKKTDFDFINDEAAAGLRLLVEQNCIHLDEHTIIDFSHMVKAAFRCNGDDSEQESRGSAQFQAISVLCSVFQIPYSVKLQILENNLSNFHQSVAQYIMHDISTIRNLPATIRPDALTVENSTANIVALLALLRNKLTTDTQAEFSTVNIGGYILPSKKGKKHQLKIATAGTNNVDTPTSAYNLRNLAQAVLTERPIIVQGSSGSGKSFLIRTLAEAMGLEGDIIELHINDQTDSKTLIGSYVCSDVPGEFIWQAGVLTQAVLTGRWVVIENLDHVPLEFVATIAPLLARRRIYLPHRDREVPAHPNFRLFGTRTLAIPSLVAREHTVDGSVETTLVPPWQWDFCEVEDNNRAAYVQAQVAAAMVDYNSIVYMPTLQHFSHLFHYTCVHDLSLEEVQRILVLQYPTILPEIITKLLDVYLYINGEKQYSATKVTKSRIQQFGSGKKFGLREMLKAAGRIQANCGEFNHVSGFVSDLQKRISLQEVVDVFAGSIRTPEAYEEVVVVLGNIWGVAESEMNTFFIHSSTENPFLIQGTGTTPGNNEEKSNAICRSEGLVKIGRATISTVISSQKSAAAGIEPQAAQREQNFAMTKYSLRLLERVAVSVARNEPVLLVGETGTGKTTSVQELADILGKTLTVQNLSLSTDVSDLLGGYRPVTMKQLFLPMYEIFVRLFNDTLSSSQNTEFLQIVAKFYQAQSWKRLLKAFLKASDQATKKLSKTLASEKSRNDAAASATLQSAIEQWASFRAKIARYEANLPKIEFGFAFQFVDGLLVEALRNGDWVLLDEINLASSETLQGLSGVLDSESALFLTEKGTGELIPVVRHPDFRVFAAMNPPTDIGKKELPPSLLGRFTELYTAELTDPLDLRLVVERYLAGINTSAVADIVSVYLGCRAASEDHLTDSTGQRPRYSLRSLTRSLQAAKSFLSIGIRPFSRALFEAFLLNFQTMLSEGSRDYMHTYLKQSLYSEGSVKELTFPPSRPGGKTTTGADWVLVKPFWLRAGPLPPVDWAVRDEHGMTRFVLTKTVENNVRCLAAGVGAQVAPILIQGPTSIGKTSMVEYLAARCGFKCVRINNHEHTDVQEYIGGYVTNSNGQLEFKDGLLIEALRKGHWIILDELNLAPSDVLEALNRLLDDNKELLIPETGELVKPAPGFTLFATQNPPGIYGGRKPLSRAFKNRFLELSVCDLPLPEVEEIVTQSCGIPPKFSAMLVKTMQELQIHRQKSTLFQGKYGSITTRDLIKWGRRKPSTPLEVAQEGYMLIAEKLRSAEEKELVCEILNKVCKAQLNPAELYQEPTANATAAATKNDKKGSAAAPVAEICELTQVQSAVRSGSVTVDGMQNIAVTATMRRMWELVNRALKQNEPVLLIGETGCGKTTVCQLYAAHKDQKIRILNCHQSTETADLIGGLRPIRGREVVKSAVVADVLALLAELGPEIGLAGASNKRESPVVHSSEFVNIRTVYEAVQSATAEPAEAVQKLDESLLKAALDEFAEVLNKLNEESGTASPAKKSKREVHAVVRTGAESERLVELSAVVERALGNWQRCRSLFEWQDGPLITAMKEGDVFVIDEINLADDAVIERLNSVLESGRSITLAEKGGMASELIVAHPRFKLLATMNPGGDFGKRELSPALRSRFTEIWIPSATNPADIALIVKEILSFSTILSSSSEALADHVAVSMIEFMHWMNQQCGQWILNGIQISVREILAWAKFINQSSPQSANDVYTAYIHGAFMIMLDGLGIGISVPREKIRQLKQDCLVHLIAQCSTSGEDGLAVVDQSEFFLSTVTEVGQAPPPAAAVVKTDTSFSVGKFSIPLGPLHVPDSDVHRFDATNSKQQKEYVLDARITALNLGRILRAMQLPRAILLEGPPGVGKSSLIANLAALTGHTLVRINLSEHSELSDLLGTDLPAAAVADSPVDLDDSGENSAVAAVSLSNSDSAVPAVSSGDADAKPASSNGGPSNTPSFKWCDGVFLTAMKQGHWVLLDELNLAPQSVLEGLNACFDHRQEVFLPDIGQTVTCPSTFRVFCAQNPMVEGGGRKGLPQSFLSRFSRVFVEAMTEEDLLEIVSSAFNLSSENQGVPVDTLLGAIADAVDSEMDVEQAVAGSTATVPVELAPYVAPMVKFTQRLQHNIVTEGQYGHTGGPWEFNLRDIFRWCEAVLQQLKRFNLSNPGKSADTAVMNGIVSSVAYVLFVRRMRTAEDRDRLCADFASVFGFPLLVDASPSITSTASVLTVGHAEVPVQLSPHYLHRNLPLCDAISSIWKMDNAPSMQVFSKSIESLMHCISLQWPVLLVGPHGSGKHRVMQYLATQTGHVIDHFAVSPSTDSTELLGSFEQVSASRHLNLGVNFLQQACVAVTRIALDNYTQEVLESVTINELRALCGETLASFQSIYEESLVVAADNSLHLDEGKRLLASVQSLVDKLWAFASYEGLLHADSVEKLGFGDIKALISSALNEVRIAVKYSTGGDGSSGFEWVDGIIVKAVLQGKWLVIDNINLCSASVLDRLNSLLEPNGTLLLTECGDGRVITPHKDFRIFFAMDPTLGEISRAMRNRCVEMAFLPTDSDNKWSISRYLVQQENIPMELHDTLHDFCVGLNFTPMNANNGVVVTKGLKVKSAGVLLNAHFPKYQLFSRIVQLVSLNLHFEQSKTCALTNAINSVLPGFTVKAALKCNSSTGVAAKAESEVSDYQHSIKQVFNQAYITQDVYMALDMLVELVRDHQLSLWMYQIISQAERRSTLAYCPLSEHISAVRAALSPEIVADDSEEAVVESSTKVINLRVEDQVVLVLNLLVNLTYTADNAAADEFTLTWTQQLVVQLLELLDLHDQYVYWLQLCHSYYTRTLSTEVETHAAVLNPAKWKLVHLVQFQRSLVLEQERLSAEFMKSVSDPIVLQNRPPTAEKLSIHTIALGIEKDLIVIDSRELSIINAIYQVVGMVDQVVNQFLSSDDKFYQANVTDKYNSVVSTVGQILLKRDALCKALCSSYYSESASARQNQQLLPWDEISICTRWLKKSIKLLGEAYARFESIGAQMHSVCTSAESELGRFDRAVCAYWHRPVMSEKLRLWKEGGHAAVPALPVQWQLLFELRKIVNLLRDTETTSSFVETSISKLPPLMGYQAHKAFGLQKEWLYLYSTYYWACTNEESVDGAARCLAGALAPRKKNVNIASLLAGLSTKFQEYNTATVLPDLLVLNDTECFDYDDGSTGGMGLQYTEYVHNRISRERQAACEQSLCAVVEPIVIRNLLQISNNLGRLVLAASVPKGIAGKTESVVLPNLNASEWTDIRDLSIRSIDLSLRYTNFHPSQLRELQSLAWAIEAYLASTNKDSAVSEAKLVILLQLARVFVVTLETRIFAFTSYSTHNHLAGIPFDFSSPTLDMLLDASANNTGSVEAGGFGQSQRPTVMVPWEQSICAGYVRLLQPVSAEVAFRHLDIQTICARYQNGGSALRLFNHNTAKVTISSCKVARRRLYQLMRASVASARKHPSPTGSVQLTQTSSIATDDEIKRLDLLMVYVLDILRSCRDFYEPALAAELTDLISAEESIHAEVFAALAAMDLASRIKIGSISALFKACLQPVLEFVVASAANQNTLVDIGAAWVNIGLLRLHLLLPTMPVDPAAKSAIKSRLLQVQNGDLHQTMSTSYVHRALSDTVLLTQESVDDLNTLTARKIDIERLNGRGIQRPESAAPFVEVYFEIKSALEGILSIDRLHNLLQGINAGHASVKESAFAGAARAHGAAFTTVKSVLREELAWQATALTLVQRLEQNFLAYEDIVSTVVAAVGHVSNGLRVVAGVVHQECAGLVREEPEMRTSGDSTGAVLIREDNSTSTYVSVMQYPFSLSVPLNNTSSAVVKDHLLSPIALLLSGMSAVCNKAVDALTVAKMSDSNDSNFSRGKAPDAKNITSVVPHIVLLHALSRVEYLISGRTVDIAELYSVFQNTLDKFVEAYLKELDEKRKQAALKEALFRNREKTFESDDLKEEEAAYKEHFPDHLAAFKSLNLTGANDAAMGITAAKPLGEEEDDELAPVVPTESEEEADEERMLVDESTTTEVVSHHVRMVFFELVKHCADLHLTYGSTAADHSVNSAVISALVSTKYKLQSSLCSSTLVTSKALDWALRGVIAPQLDAQLRGTSLMGLAAMASKCVATDSSISTFNYAASAASIKKLLSKRIKASPDSQPDRDLLLLLNDESDETASEWKPLDFHKDPNPQESFKATEILQNIFDRSSELLVQFPGNELLLQVCKVSAKISEFHVSTPIGKMLISLQLLLQKAEEWEMFAAKHVSLRAQMADLSNLIAQWRELELKTWETLLRSKEVSYARAATLNWYTLMRMLNGQPIVQRDPVTEPSTGATGTHAWPSLDVFAPQWLKSGYRSALSAAQAVDETNTHADAIAPEVVHAPKLRFRCPEMFEVAVEQMMTESQYLAKIFTTLDGFMRSSVVGEFPTRLHLLRLFALQLQLECKVSLAGPSDTTAGAVGLSKKNKRKTARAGVAASTTANMLELKARLANIVTGIWQYYDQFLPSLRKFQDTLKGPIQAKLKGEVKIGKWDQLNTYALIEYSEKIHRKLNKFLREYQGDVLDHPFSAILRRELLDDFVTKAGELQSATAVPSVGSICPALHPLGDGSTGTNPEQLLQSPISNSEYFVAVRNGSTTGAIAVAALTSIVSSDDAVVEAVKAKYSRIFKVDTYTSRMRKYLTELIIPAKGEASALILRSIAKPDAAPVPVELDEDGNPVPVTEKVEEVEEELEVQKYNYFGAQIFHKKSCYGLQGALMAEDLCHEIFARIESLRSESVPKPMKQRAVRDLLTTLKDHGISHLRNSVSVELRQNLHLFSMNAPLSCETMADLQYNSGNPKYAFDKAESYYTKAISEVTQLRSQSTAAISHDISNRDAMTMVALSENMLGEEVKLRAAIGAALLDYKSLLSAMDSLNSSVSVDSTSSNATTVGGTQSELVEAVKANQLLAQVMLDNLIQLHALLLSATDANAASNIEAEHVLPVASVSQSKKTTQVLSNIISIVATIAMGGESSASKSGNDIAEQSLFINIGSLHLSTKPMLSIIESAQLLQKQAEHAAKASTMFATLLDSMVQLVSADVVGPVQTRLLEFCESVACNSTKISVETASETTSTDIPLVRVLDTIEGSSSTLGSLVSKCIDDCLVSVQKLRTLGDLQTLSDKTNAASVFSGCYGETIQAYNGTDNQESGTEEAVDANAVPQVILHDCVTLSISSIAACQLHKVAADVNLIQAHLAARVDGYSPAERSAASAVVRTLFPVLQLLTQAFSALLDGLVLEYKSVGKLLYITVRIFRTLLAKGICAATTEDGEDDGSGDLSNMLFQDNVEGTGMGEGEGKKDVSDQIENEEQLLGLKDDVPKDPGEAKKQEKKTLKEEEKDQGVEMTQDFEGEMFDIPSDDENKNDESDEDEGEEPEKEMGDANAEDIVDEKQWDEDDNNSDSGEDGQGKEEEKFEKNSKMQGEAIEGEMRTREDDEDAQDKPEEDKSAEKDKAPEKSDEPEEAAPDDQKPGSDRPEDNQVNEDKEEGTMDKPMGVDVRKDEKPEPTEDEEGKDDDTPDEMDLDNEKDDEDRNEGEEAGDDGMPAEGEGEGENPDSKDEGGDDLPDDMNLDGGDDDQAGDEEDNDAMDVEPEENEDQEGAEGNPAEADNQGEEGEEPEMDMENKPVSGAAGELPEQNEEQKVNEEEEKEEEGEEEAEPNESDGSKPATFGVRNDAGQEALLNAQDDENSPENEDNKNASKQQQQQPPSALSAEQPQGKGGVSQGESKHGATHEIGGTHREDDGDQPPPPRKQEPPNPFKQAGNVNEKWHRRLNLVLPPDEEQGASLDDGLNDTADDDNDDVPDGGGKGLYEHASKEEGAMEQVLADVAEEDAVQLPDSGEKNDNQRDAASAMEQDNNAPDEPAKEDDGADDRKRNRDEDRYKGHKAKKKRLNDDAAPEPVEGDVPEEPEVDAANAASDDGTGSDIDGDSDGSDSDDEKDEIVPDENQDIFEGSKVFTKEQFKFGATSELQQNLEPETDAELTVNHSDGVVISANRLAKGRLVWQQHRAATESYSMRLCEQLRLILEPTLATRLRGDYRTGKRINMRKVIPYVASGFRKDKIWLRRTKPAKRAYQVMIMIDDSMSMGAAGPLALSSLATIANALTRLEIGELSITSFATDVNVLHKFGTPFTEEAGARVVSQFKFQASSTLLSASLAAVLPVFTQARSSAQSSAAGANAAVLQICFVISDARIDSDNREKLEQTVRTLSEQHILVVLVIIDCNEDAKDSIFNTKSVSFVGNKVMTKSYFDDFPFPYYVALQKVEALPDVLSDALKQWFELVRLQTGN